MIKILIRVYLLQRIKVKNEYDFVLNKFDHANICE